MALCGVAGLLSLLTLHPFCTFWDKGFYCWNVISSLSLSLSPFPPLRTVVTSLNDLEVQYNICGIIVNLAMIEADLWSAIVSPSKDDLLNIVVSLSQKSDYW